MIAAPAGSPGSLERRAVPLALLAVVGGATVAAVALGAGPLVAAAPVLGAAAAYAVARNPLRATVLAFLLLVLALDDRRNAGGVWHTPWAFAGDFLRANLDSIVPAARGVKLNGMELVVVALLALAAWRRARGDRIDLRGAVPAATVAFELAGVAVAAILLATAHGLARGGSLDTAIWQTRPLLDTIALFALFAVALRGPPDHVALGKVIVLAASLRALLAIWVRYGIAPTVPGHVAYTTDHGDSVLFALACAVLLTHLLERLDSRRLLQTVLFLPPILLGMHANARRVAWVQLAVVLVAVFLATPWHRWHRRLARAALVAAPLVLLYAAAGWSAEARVFAPVHTFRSVVQNDADRSTWARHVENWNLAVSLRDRPLAGRGFGHEWDEVFVGDEIVSIFPQYRSAPHNQVLGLLLFAGVASFTAIWGLLALTVFLALRAYRLATAPEDRAAALCCAGAVLVAAVQFHGDMGAFWMQSRVLLALALAVSAKLAVATGAWPARAAPPALGGART
jgi:hypothetical protein